MEGKSRIKAIQRIYKDLKEIDENPIEGLSIVMPDENDPFTLRANILILDGMYKDVLLHMIMTIPQNYPLTAPKMIIAPGQTFSHEFHHHVFGDIQCGYTICIDLLDHGFFMTSSQTGWTPAYTLSTILMQMQVFFAKDHDLVHIPTKMMIENLKENSKKFVVSIQLTDKTKRVHSYTSPYPPIVALNTFLKPKETDQQIIKRKKAYARLTCYLTRNTPADTEVPLGYPMNISRDAFDRINSVPILEILSYEGYMTQLASSPEKVFESKSFDYHKLRTAMGSEYNYWFPLYINEEIFQKNKQYIFNAVSVIKYGIEGKKKFDFQPEQILVIFPCLMNKMIVALQTGNLFQSYASIEAYCHFMRLFYKLIEEFPALQNIIDEKVEKVLKNEDERNKKNLGDMGEFLILLAFSKFSFNSVEIWKELIKEYISRQFLWVIKKVDKNEGFFVEEADEIKKSTLLFFYQINGNEMDEFYRASKISNNLLLFNCNASKKFLSNKQEFINKIDQNYGVVEEKDVEEFMKEIKTIKPSINTYADLLKFIGLGEIYPDYFSLLNLFRIALKTSYIQGYNSFKLSKMSFNFLQKADYLSLLVRWFLEGSPLSPKIIDYFIKPEQNQVLVQRMGSEELNVYGKDSSLFPFEFKEFGKDEKAFIKEILNRKFFYFWILLSSSTDLNNIPKSLLLDYFTLTSKDLYEKKIKNQQLLIKVFSESQILSILKAFSIVFSITINALFSKYKVLTLQTLCFYIRVFRKLIDDIPEIHNHLEKSLDDNDRERNTLQQIIFL